MLLKKDKPDNNINGELKNSEPNKPVKILGKEVVKEKINNLVKTK